MKIDAARDGGSAVLQLEGRLDREWAEHLSHTLEDLLQDGVRSLDIDFSRSPTSARPPPRCWRRWQQELAMLRGEVRLTSLSPAVREGFAVAGWNPDVAGGPGGAGAALRRWYLHAHATSRTSGQYELASAGAGATLTCRLLGDPDQLTRSPLGADDCRAVDLPDGAFGLGLAPSAEATTSAASGSAS